jgi:hypothetical protein
MRLRETSWHTVVVSICLVAGCYDMHGRGSPLPGPGPDPEPPPPPRDAGADVRDFRDVWLVDAAAIDRCAELFALLGSGVPPESIGCDGRTFPRDCVELVSPCCQAALVCNVEPTDGGTVGVVLSCDDWCDQSCGAYAPEHCAFIPGCEFFAPHACGPAPGFIEGPACIYRRGGPCSTDADCSDGQRCHAYWINPCEGLPCAACGGEEHRCSY